MANTKPGKRGRELTAAYKLLVVQERLRGTRILDVATAYGVSGAAVQKWVKAFQSGGPGALESRRGKAGRRRATSSPVPREQVISLKRDHEDWGTRRIRDVLRRFEALGVSEQEVR